MKCFGKDAGVPCDKQGTKADPETPAMFINPEDPTGPTVQPVLCDKHFHKMMADRDENEASWRRSIFRT